MNISEVRKLAPSLFVLLLSFTDWLVPYAAVAQDRTYQIDLVESVRPEPLLGVRQTLRVGGINLGMSVEEVAVYISHLTSSPKAIVTESALSLEAEGKKITSQPYVSRLNTRDLSYRVYFSAPTIGHRIVSVSNTVVFTEPEKALHVPQVIAELVATYGKPASQAEAAGSTYLTWNYGAQMTLSCLPSAPCFYSKEPGRLPAIARLQRELDQDHRLVLSATIEANPDAAGAVQAYGVTLEDVGNELLSLQEAERQMLHAATVP